MSAIADVKKYLLGRKADLLAEYQEVIRPHWDIFGPSEEEERERLIKRARCNAAMDEVDSALAALDKAAIHKFSTTE